MQNMRITLSRHAERQLKERALTKALIRKVLNKLDKVIDRSDGTKVAQKRVKWHTRDVLCRVIYALPHPEIARVITAYITTKFTKYQ